MKPSILAVAALGYVVYRQAHRIRRLNTALHLVQVEYHQEMEGSDRQIEELAATVTVLRRENTEHCRQAVYGTH